MHGIRRCDMVFVFFVSSKELLGVPTVGARNLMRLLDGNRVKGKQESRMKIHTGLLLSE